MGADGALKGRGRGILYAIKDDPVSLRVSKRP